MPTAYTAARAASTFPVASAAAGGVLQAAYGTYTIATALGAADTIALCKLPPNATVIGGYVQAKDIDTGTEALDIDIGWAANGAEIADPDGFGNLGQWDGDAVSFVRPEVGNYYVLGGVLFTAGPKTFTAETTVQATCNVAANAGGTGNITVVVFFIVA